MDDEEFDIQVEEEDEPEVTVTSDGETKQEPKEEKEDDYIIDDLDSKTDEKREKRKLTKSERRAFWREDRKRTEAQLKALQTRTIELEKQIQSTRGNQYGFQLEGLKNRKEELQAQYQFANQKLNEAETAGNLKATREAVEARIRIENEYKAIEQQEQQVTQIARRPTPLNSDTQNYFKGWADRNRNWFKSDLSNFDSSIADRISSDLYGEGFIASQPEFWEELDRRCEDYIPAKRRMRREPKYEYIEDEPPQTVSGKGSRSRNDSGRQEVKIDAWTVDQWKNAGIWDDPKERQKAIKEYQSQMNKESARG